MFGFGENKKKCVIEYQDTHIEVINDSTIEEWRSRIIKLTYKVQGTDATIVDTAYNIYRGVAAGNLIIGTGKNELEQAMNDADYVLTPDMFKKLNKRIDAVFAEGALLHQIECAIEKNYIDGDIVFCKKDLSIVETSYNYRSCTKMEHFEVISTENLFEDVNCKSIDLSEIVAVRCHSMNKMFYKCTADSVTLPKNDIVMVHSANEMFKESNIECVNFGGIIFDCENVSNIDWSNNNIKKVITLKKNKEFFHTLVKNGVLARDTKFKFE